jgi:hypothetical protein
MVSSPRSPLWHAVSSGRCEASCPLGRGCWMRTAFVLLGLAPALVPAVGCLICTGLAGLRQAARSARAHSAVTHCQFCRHDDLCVQQQGLAQKLRGPLRVLRNHGELRHLQRVALEAVEHRAPAVLVTLGVVDGASAPNLYPEPSGVAGTPSGQEPRRRRAVMDALRAPACGCRVQLVVQGCPCRSCRGRVEG